MPDTIDFVRGFRPTAKAATSFYPGQDTLHYRWNPAPKPHGAGDLGFEPIVFSGDSKPGNPNIIWGGW